MVKTRDESVWRTAASPGKATLRYFEPLKQDPQLKDAPGYLYAPFAPVHPDPLRERTPRYFKIGKDDTAELFSPGFDFKEDVYVSVYCLAGLGKGETPLNAKLTPSDDPSKRWPKWEDDFLKSWQTVCQKLILGDVETPPTIPVREADGKIVTATLSKHFAVAWLHWLADNIGAPKQSGGKPARYVYFTLTHPLLIVPGEDSRKEMIEGRFGDFSTLFETMIEAVHKKAFGDSNAKSWTLEFTMHAELNGKHEGYIDFSVNPFGLYRTMIHTDDWTAYMRQLNTPGRTSSVRTFPRVEKSLVELMDKSISKIGARDIKLQYEMSREDFEVFDLNPDVDRPTASELINQKGRAPKNSVQEKRLEGLTAMYGRVSRENCSTEFEIGLDVRKIEAAQNKRDGESGQSTVMAGLSATDASQIASKLGWETRRLYSGFYAAEWLHVSAFSWGGYAEVDVAGGFSTSQNMENLVFGTSETNSLMTRYETAWQKLFMAEKKLYALAYDMLGPPPPIQGFLRIECNDLQKPFEYDLVGADGKYTKGTFDFSEVDKKYQNTLDHIATHYKSADDTSAKVEQQPDDAQASTHGQILALAHDFNFMVYSIDYEVACAFESFMLNTHTPGNSFRFFPFRRPFFHYAEMLLDDIVFDVLEKQAQDYIQGEIFLKDVKETKELRMKMVADKSKQKRIEVIYDDQKRRMRMRIDERQEQNNEEKKKLPFHIIRNGNGNQH